MSEHKYDKGGICIYCDRCPEQYCDCGWEEECDRRNVIRLNEIMERIQEEWKERRLNLPTDFQ